VKLPEGYSLAKRIRAQRKLVRRKRGYVDPELQHIVDTRNAKLAAKS
jgi:hypothetical protein